MNEMYITTIEKVSQEHHRSPIIIHDGWESALLAAEFALICHYSNIEYDNCYIARIAE